MIDWRITRVDSPIQAALAEPLCVSLAFYITRSEHLQVRSELPIALASRNIRADFALILTDSAGEQRARLIVECDGADFHDAERDAQRDRDAEACGWSTLRFTGSQIHASPYACAAEVVRELSWVGRDKRAAHAEAAE